MVFESHEVTDEDGCLLLIHQSRELLVLLIAAHPCGELQCGNGFRVPGMFDAILTPMELALVGKHPRTVCGIAATMPRAIRFLPHDNGIVGYLLQADATNGGNIRTEICLQQALAETYALKNLRPTVAPDG